MSFAKKIILFLVVFALIASLFPTAFAQTNPDVHFKGEKATVEISLTLEENHDTITPLQNVRTDRIRNIFPDPNLARVIAEAFGVGVNNFVTQTDLNRVVAFAANNENIQNLQGMQFLHNLREVSFLDNRISDLEPLRNLTNLERLLLDNNRIVSLSPLQNLRSLEWLWLDDNQISNLTPLAGLENLVWLTLWGNRIENINSLRNLTNLVSLWLADNHIRDIYFLRNLYKLEVLTLAGNTISNFRPLHQLDNMQVIWVGTQETQILPSRLNTDPLAITNPIIAPNGRGLEPSFISHEGIHHNSTLAWYALPENTRQVYANFATPISVGEATDILVTRVVQRVSQTPFQDVSYRDWFYQAVIFVFQQGLMGGVSHTHFAPMDYLDRSMTVVMMHRLAGSPEGNSHTVWGDLPLDTWYTDSALWAFENGIVQGYGQAGVFNGQGIVTREQFATFLHRLAMLSPDFSPPAEDFSLSNFSDYQTISPWAYEAFRWVLYTGLFTGTPEGFLHPGRGTSRLECAVVAMRFAKMGFFHGDYPKDYPEECAEGCTED